MRTIFDMSFDDLDDNVLINRILKFYGWYGVYAHTKDPQVIFEKRDDIGFKHILNNPEQYVLAVRYDYDTYLTLLHVSESNKHYCKFNVKLSDILSYEFIEE